MTANYMEHMVEIVIFSFPYLRFIIIYSFWNVIVWLCRSASGKTEVKVILDHLPTELFKRTVVRGKLDLVGKFPVEMINIRLSCQNLIWFIKYEYLHQPFSPVNSESRCLHGLLPSCMQLADSIHIICCSIYKTTLFGILNLLIVKIIRLAIMDIPSHGKEVGIQNKFKLKA
jgi:hypothetical protein